MKMTNYLTAAAGFLLFLTIGCSSELPYLTLTVESVYTTSDISIAYSFKSEQSEQPCRVSLSRTDGSDEFNEDWLREEWMEEAGTLNFNGLSTGDYQLQFVVLSARGSSRAELSFLDETYYFSVNY